MVEIAMRRSGAKLIPVDDLAADDLVRVPADRDVMVKIVSHKNMKLWRMLWALASKVSDACDHLHDREDAMDELKIRTRYVKYITNPVTGEVRIVPKSLTKLDGAGLNRLADRMIYVICRDIVPGMDEGALKSEVLAIISGERNSNSVEASVLSNAQPTPAAAQHPLPSAAGDPSSSSPGDETSADGVETQAPSASALPQGWEILYASALRRAQKQPSLQSLARQFWAQFGGWGKHKDGPDGPAASAIFDAFNNNFGNADAINTALRELI
jgi:hypothetical protein